MRISAISSFSVPSGAPIAKIVQGDVWLWPQGLGEGPTIIMSPDEWKSIYESVASLLHAERDR